jgi:aryl-alcohol dehydrogenase-like predicted oxidoreductase
MSASVRKRPLGKTGIVVSEMALGTWGLSGEGYGPVEPADAEKVVARALEIGFTLFETSDAYAGGHAELLLGKCLEGKKDLVVATRIGVDRTTTPPRKRFELDYVREAVRRSRKRLKRERIEVVLLHNPSLDAIVIGEPIGELEDLKKKGEIQAWGVSAGDAEIARTAIDKGAEVVELPYNLLHSIDLHRVSGDVMVARCGVLARSTLNYGMLTGMWAKDRDFPEGDHRTERWTRLELERRIEQLDAVRFLVKGDVLTLRAAAVRYVLANHLVSSAVLGPRTVAQLEQLVREVGAGPRYLPDDDLAALPRALSKVGILT